MQNDTYWVSGNRLYCGSRVLSRVDLVYIFTPSGAIVVSDSENPRGEGAKFTVHRGSAYWCSDNRPLPNLDLNEAMESPSTEVFCGALLTQVHRVLPVGLNSFLVRVGDSFASHSISSLYFLSGWDTCNRFEHEHDGYGNPPTPDPIAVSPNGSLALCDNGTVIGLPRCEVVRREPAVPSYAHWVNDSHYLITERKPQSFNIWNADFKVVASTGPHGPDIVSVAFDDYGRYIATATSSRRVRVWHSETSELMSLKRFSDVGAFLVFSDKEGVLDITFRNGFRESWHFRRDNELDARTE